MLGCRVSLKELWDFWWKRTKHSMSSFKTNLLRLPRVRWDEASPNVFWVLDCDDVMMYHLQIITRNQSDTIWRNIFHKDFFLTFYVGLDNGRRGLMFFRPKSLPSLRYCTSFWGRERRRYREITWELSVCVCVLYRYRCVSVCVCWIPTANWRH